MQSKKMISIDWRTAFCTAPPGVDADENEEERGSTSPTGLKSCACFGFFSNSSATPRSSSSDPSPRSEAITEALDAEPRLLTCRTVSALLGSHSDTSSPLNSRLMFNFWKSGFKSESNDCGIHANSIAKGKKSATSTLPTSRCYNDDEPLTSLGFRNSKFYTIPEECEEVDEEFKEVGDAVNDRHPPYEQSGRVRVEILPERAVISSNRSYETHVALLTVKAAPLQFGALQHVPVDLVVVLDLNCDTSGDKFEVLRAAMNLVISSLGSSDRLSIVSFAENSKRMLALKRMTSRGRRMARVTIDCLLCGTQRGRCVREALGKASKVLEDRCQKNPVSSIILLSDIGKEAVQVADFYSELMTSTGCKTRFAYIEISSKSNSRLSKDIFAKSLAGILNVVVQDVKIDLGFAESVGSAEIASVYSRNKGQFTLLGSGSIWLGDMYVEEERGLLVEMRIPYFAIGSNLVMVVHCRYNDPACGKAVHCEDQKVLVYGPRVSERSNPRSERLGNVFITTRSIAESKKSIDRDDYGGARRLIASARALMMQSGSRSGNECAKALETEFMEIHRRKQKKMEMESMRRRKQGKGDRAEPLAHPKILASCGEAGRHRHDEEVIEQSQRFARIRTCEVLNFRILNV